MALLVHLAPEKSTGAIRRGGIKPWRARPEASRGVFAMPVLPNFFVSHQWLRELRRSGQRTFVGVYFRIGDDEEVRVGHYGRRHLEVAASRAIGIVLEAADPRGYEIVIPRKIEPAEIHAIRSLPQVVGWRYMPDAHGRRPCGCPVCAPRGGFGSKALREAFERELRGGGDS